MSSERGGMVLTPCTLPLDLPLIANQQMFLQHKKHPLKPYLLNIQHFFLLLTFRTGAFSLAMRISWILSTKWNQGIIGIIVHVGIFNDTARKVTILTRAFHYKV